MQIDAQKYLRLVENAKTLVFLDIEASGLRGDYNSVLVTSIKPFGRKPVSRVVLQPGNDQRVVRETKEALETADVWVTYYGKGYDIPMLNTRLLKWGIAPIEKRPHIDLYYALKYKLLTARRSQGHLLEWLETPQSKMSVSAEVWAGVAANPGPNLRMLRARCESDAAGLEALYRRTSHLLVDITR